MALTPRMSASAASSVSLTGRFCPSSSERAGVLMETAARLQPRQELGLQHPKLPPALRHPRADNVPISQRESTPAHIT